MGNMEVWENIERLERQVKKLMAENHALRAEIAVIKRELSEIRIENKEILWQLSHPHPQVEEEIPF